MGTSDGPLCNRWIACITHAYPECRILLQHPATLVLEIWFVSSDQPYEPFLDRQCKHRMEDLSLAEVSSNAMLTAEAAARWLIAVNK